MTDRKRKFSQLSDRQQRRIAQHEIESEEDVQIPSSSEEADNPNDNNGSSPSSNEPPQRRQRVLSSEDESSPPIDQVVVPIHVEIEQSGDISIEIGEEQGADISDDDAYLFSDEDELDFLSDNEEEQNEDELTEKLRDFCLRHMRDYQTNELLQILRSNPHLSQLPKDHNDLYQTPNIVMPEPSPIEGGHYLHFGIKANLKFIELKNPNLKELTLHFSWDGVKLFKSSPTNIWPIVMYIEELPDEDVHLVGMFVGTSKPKNPNEFFHCLNEEIKEIQNSNFEAVVGATNRRCTLHGGCFTADVPAKTWALGNIHDFYTFFYQFDSCQSFSFKVNITFKNLLKKGF